VLTETRNLGQVAGGVLLTHSENQVTTEFQEPKNSEIQNSKIQPAWRDLKVAYLWERHLLHFQHTCGFMYYSFLPDVSCL
jgi:hypothetical protein